MKWFGIVVCCLIVSCSGRDPIEDARGVVKSHEDYSGLGNLDGIVSNAADDIVIMVAGAPLIEGKQAVRDFFSTWLAMGKQELSHEFHGVEAISNGAVVHGVAKGRMVKVDGTVMEYANNFIMILKYQPEGRMRFWRVAIAPGTL